MTSPLSQPPPDAPLPPSPEGFHEEWLEEPNWRLADYAERVFKRCRRLGCTHPPAAALRRGDKRLSWWLYCEHHLYGRRIANGRVEYRALVPEEG
jgi:hypothetical protein